MREKDRGTILSWIKIYPIKAMLILLLIIVPIVVIIVSLVTFNKNGKKFYFDKTEDEITYLYNKDLSNNKEISKYIDLELDLKRITYTFDSNNELNNSTYNFKLNYTLSDEYKNRNTSVSFRWVLKADWINEQADAKSVYPSSTNNSNINFDYVLPVRKYMFFNILYPNLFLEIKIETTTSAAGISTTETDILYYKYNISKVMKNNNKIEIVEKYS